MQRQLAQQLLELSFVTHQPQVGGAQHRLQQRVGRELGDPVGEPDRQAGRLAVSRFAHLVGDALAQMKDLFGAREGGLARLGERHTATRWLEQLVAQRLLKLAHLRADGLHRHVQPIRGAGEPTFLSNDPEIVEMAVVQHVSSIAEKPKFRCVSVWFVRSEQVSTL